MLALISKSIAWFNQEGGTPTGLESLSKWCSFWETSASSRCVQNLNSNVISKIVIKTAFDRIRTSVLETAITHFLIAVWY